MRNRFLFITFTLALTMIVPSAVPAAQKLPGETATEAASESAPDEAPEAAPDEAPEAAPDEAPEEVPEAAPDKAPETASVPDPSDSASDVIVPDLTGFALSDMESLTESEDGSLVETEMIYEIPAGIVDDLVKNEPVGEAAGLTSADRRKWMEEICEANSPEMLWERHENVSALFHRYDADAGMWKEFSCSYLDPLVYYSDDWTPGLEELRLLIYDGNSCVEDYMNSMRFICFLNASGLPYRDPASAPVTLDENTRGELLLKIRTTPEALYVITQLAKDSALHLGLDDPKEDAFYSCLYLLDPVTLDVMLLQISLHDNAGSVTDVERVSFSYDTGMTPFVEAGYEGLLRHMMPDFVWAPEYLRTVTLTLDPGTKDEKVYPLTVLKGDPVSITLPEGYELYSDESLTRRWIDDGNYSTDLALWAAPGETMTKPAD